MGKCFRINCVVLLTVVANLVALHCYSQNISFLYNGPDTIYVDEDCIATLDWGGTAALDVTCSTPGCNISSVNLDMISGGWQLDDTVPPNNLILISYSAEDNFGNFGFFNFDILFLDTLPPNLNNFNNDVTIECDQLAAFSNYSATDNCDPSPTVFYNDIFSSGSCPNQYTLSRTIWVSDQSGNTSGPFDQTIEVVDLIAPVFTSPASNIEISCTDETIINNAFNDWINAHGNGIVNDNCSPDGALTWFAAEPGSYTLTDPSTHPGVSPGNLDAAQCPSSTNSVYRTEQVDFVVIDECGNANFSSANFTVVDTEFPQITECPLDTTLADIDGNCEESITFNIPGFTDNCDNSFFQFAYQVNQDPLVSPNHFQPFEIIFSVPVNEVNYYLTDCAGNTDTCTFIVTINDSTVPSISCPTDTSFYLSGGDDCSIGKSITLPVPANLTDNCPLADPVQIEFYTQGASNLTPAIFNSTEGPEIILAEGITEVFYVYKDQAENADTCSFQIQILDTIAPSLICTNHEMLLNPSETSIYVLNPNNFINTLLDNCGVPSLTISPGNVSCVQFGTSVPVSITATDSNGNSSTCQTEVAVELEQAIPSYNTSVCENETLNLFANPPPEQGSAYTYAWEGPNGFQSSDANPEISNVSTNEAGLYAVTVTGHNNCMVSNTIEVSINERPIKPIIATNDASICTSEIINLNTSSYSSGQVVFHWYEGDHNNYQLLNSNGENLLNIDAGTQAGQKDFFLIVELNGCTSDPSEIISVQIFDKPIAEVNDELLTVCFGESLELGSNSNGSGYSYQWSGPNGYSSNQQFPPSITDVSFEDAGTYQLLITNDGCSSLPAHTAIIVDPLPETPIIDSGAAACLGQSINLSTANNGAENYYWTRPDGSVSLSTQPFLNFNNLTTADSGLWFLIVEKNGCTSLPSPNVNVLVESPQDMLVSNNGPFCQTGVAQLNALELEDANYFWTGPGNFSSSEVNPAFEPPVEGLYELQVITANGCINEGNTLLETSVTPVITAIANSGSPCMDAEAPINFSASVFPANDPSFTFEWQGPDGFQSNILNLEIQDLQSLVNGSYALTVSNGDGCMSEPQSTILDFSIMPETPAITAQDSLCEGDILTLSTTAVSNEINTYNWITPMGPIQTTEPFLTFENINVNNSGNYSLNIEAEGCESENAALFPIHVSQIPDVPLVSSNSPVCLGEMIVLESNSPTEATYNWWSDNGFTSSNAEIIIEQSIFADSGDYFLQISLNGCFSETSLSEYIEVIDKPITPVLLHDTDVCLDNPEAQLGLSIDPATAVENAVYYWYNENSDLIAGPTFDQQIFLNNLQGYSAGNHSFTAVAFLNDCESDTSLPAEVNFETAPDEEAIAGENVTTCEIVSFQLAAQNPQQGFGTWIQLDGPPVTIEDPNDPNTNLIGLSQGNRYTFAWSLSNDICFDYSNDEVMIVIDNVDELAEAGPSQTICEDTSILLDATAPAGDTNGHWSQSEAQEQSGVLIEDVNNPNTLVSGLQPGMDYEFVWILSNAGCGEFSSDVLEISIIENDGIANAGIDFEYCGQGSLRLSADDPGSGTGIWTVNSNAVDFENLNEATSFVSGLADGGYTFIWSVDNGICGSSADTIRVNYNLGPQATDDEYDIKYAGRKNLKVVENDNVDEAFFVSITKVPDHGELVVLGDGEFQFNADNFFTGEDFFDYNLCYFDCLEGCSQARVSLHIGEDAQECKLPTIFSPNNDGVNDALVIPCLTTGNFQNNSLVVFNQWGDEVFKAKPYQNNWEGLYKGDLLPVGTYYYILEFGNGQQPLSNFLQLER